MIKVAVLLSVGAHPASGRARRAPLDARALELALRLPEVEIHAIHAGDPAEAALRDYLGMGLPRLSVLAIPPGADPVPPLADHLRCLAPDLMLAGSRAENGWDSGMVPYLLAAALGCGIAADAAGLSLAGGKALITQALPKGRRRLIEMRLPAMVTASLAALTPRQFSFAAARRGKVERVEVVSPAPQPPQQTEIRPWRPRPKRLPAPSAGAAQDRLKAMTETRSGAGMLMVQPDPEDAARAIHDYLLKLRLIGERR